MGTRTDISNNSKPAKDNDTNVKILDLNTIDFDNKNYYDIDNNIKLCNSEYLTIDEIPAYFDSNPFNCNVLHVNCRSLQKNFDHLKNLISFIKIPLLAIGVTETWLKPHNKDIFNLEGFSFVNEIREGKTGGGVGLYINSGEQFRIISNLTYTTDIIECIFVEIIRKATNVIIGCVYRPPAANPNDFNAHMQSLMASKDLNNKKAKFLVGDFNLNILNHKSHGPSGIFLNTLLSNGLWPTINKPTRIADESSTLIDNIFSNVMNGNIKSAVIYSDISDHLPIFNIRTKAKNGFIYA